MTASHVQEPTAAAILELVRAGVARVEQATPGLPASRVNEEVARMLGLSLGELRQYRDVLASPPEIQQALAAGWLTIEAAVAFGCLDLSHRARVVEQIRNGVDPQQAVADAWDEAADLQKQQVDLIRRFISDSASVRAFIERGTVPCGLDLDDLAELCESLKQLSDPSLVSRVEQMQAKLEKRWANARQRLADAIARQERRRGLFVTVENWTP
jgi:hypothetical protein